SALLRSAGAAGAVLSRADRSRASAESRWLAASCTRAESTSWETRDWPSSAPGGASVTATSTTTDGRGMPANRAAVRRQRQAAALRPRQIHADHGQVPVRREDLEAPLLLAPKGVLVGKQTFQLRLGKRLVRRRGVLPHDRDAIIPAAILGPVEPGRLRGDPLDVPQLDLSLQHREVVLLEEPDELVGEAPAGLVPGMMVAVVLLGRIEGLERLHFGHDRVVPHVLGCELLDHLLRHGFLLRRVIEDRRPLLRPDVPALTVERGRVVDREEDVE